MNYKTEIEKLIEEVAEKLSLNKNQSKEERNRNEEIRKRMIENLNPDYK
jgi:hypothetical protein